MGSVELHDSLRTIKELKTKELFPVVRKRSADGGWDIKWGIKCTLKKA